MGANRTNDKRPFEVERERPTGKEVIMSIDYHLVLKLAKIQERARGSLVVDEGRHHNFSKSRAW